MKTLITCALPLLLALSQAPGKVDSTADKRTDFGSLRTYTWTRGQEAYDRAAHKLIVEAIDAQMASLGFAKAEAEEADVEIKYHAVRASDVDLDMLEKRQKQGQTDPAPTSVLGFLKVEMRAKASPEPIWQAGTRAGLSETPAIRDQEIRSAVAALFKTYPGLRKDTRR